MEIDSSNWIYSTDRMELRERCLSILLRRFGSELNEDGTPRYSTESIYGCVHDWVSHGNPKPDGIVAYYQAYYDK